MIEGLVKKPNRSSLNKLVHTLVVVRLALTLITNLAYTLGTCTYAFETNFIFHPLD
jgi:hypothetical protein